MCNYMIKKRNCRIPTKNEFCHIHLKIVKQKSLDESFPDIIDEEQIYKLKTKIANQSNELAIINNRLSEAQRKLQIIEYADYVKFALTPLAINCSFKSAIRNPNNISIIEHIFNAEIKQCENIYNELLTKRNMIAHKYTHRTWTKKLTIPSHGKSIKRLISSIKTYNLLRSPQEVY